MTRDLTRQDQESLLKLARSSIKGKLNDDPLPEIKVSDYTSALKEHRACFVTLTKNALLRGCVGSIEAAQPLVLDVRDRALGAAFQDYRFPSLTLMELEDVKIEISCLSNPEQLAYSSADELLRLLRPGIDGVILRDKSRRATFLPQVWDQLSKPEIFLGRLCLKMGLDETAWKSALLRVEIYQAEKFGEEYQERANSNS
jgi:AmmeMemoRadiSam system protein A